MDININDLSSDIIFQRENQIFYNDINELINRKLSSLSFSQIISYDNFIVDRKFSFRERYFLKLNHNIDNKIEFIEKQDPLYWFYFFDTIIDYNGKLLCLSDRKFFDFMNHVILSNIFKFFKLYEIANEEVEKLSLYEKRTPIGQIIKKCFDQNFEKFHESFGGFLFLAQNNNLDLIEKIFHLYEDHPLFSKYFNTYDKIKKEDYLNFRKFWFYLIKYQKVPITYVFKYLINFEKDEILKIALNTSKYYSHYWTKIEENRILFKKLKMNEIKYPSFDNF